MSSDGIRIQAAPRFIGEHSDEAESRYAFAYTITIHNESSEDVQLLRRHWLITDSEQRTDEVEGDGVIGQQPWIAAGTYFQYTSGAVLNTPVGTMQGEYTLQTRAGRHFTAEIPCFLLAKPGLVH